MEDCIHPSLNPAKHKLRAGCNRESAKAYLSGTEAAASDQEEQQESDRNQQSDHEAGHGNE